MILLHALFSCSAPGDGAAPAIPTSSPFELCDAQEIDGLAAKHAFQLVFNPCGTNSFLDFAWSTDGHRFYYRRGMTHRAVDASSPRRTEKNAPTSIPVGNVGWLSATRLALPLGPTATLTGGPYRLAVWDTATDALAYHDLPAELTEPTDLGRGTTADRVLFSALRDGERHAFELDLRSEELTEPFPWLLPFDTLTYTAAGAALVAGHGQTVTLYDPNTGKVRGLWSPATRGVMHPGGRWMALEHVGEPVSVFQPIGLDELPLAERDAALERARQKADLQPTDFPREVRPPTLSFVDTNTGKRFLITAVQGWQFQWWETRDYFASFVSWGFERHQYRRNVLLGDLAKWMLKAEQGVPVLGIQPASPIDDK